MSGTLTGSPSVDDLIRSILGQDDEEDDSGGITALDSLSPDRIDAVDVPASGLPFLMLKSARRKDRGGPSAAAVVLKSDGEKRYTLQCVYPADRPDRGVARDGFRDFAPASALQDAAWSFLKKGGQVGLMHEGGAGAGTVVESYLWPADDWTLTAADGSTQTVRKGDWMAGIIWSPGAWQAIKAGRLTGVSMQGGAVRRKPTAAEMAGLRKSAPKRPRCARCTAKGKGPDDKFCHKCGAPFGAVKSAAVTKAAAGVRAEAVSAGSAAVSRAAYLVKQAGDPGRREHAFTALVAEFGVETAAGLLAGDVTAEMLGSRVAKAAAADGMSRCRTCRGSGRLRHPGTGALSRKCPECQGTGQWTPRGDDEIDMTPEDMTLAGQYTQQAKAGDVAALGKLAAVVGPDVAARLAAGIPVSPADFRRGYLTAARAPQSAGPDQEPRIPQHQPVTVEMFRRGPLGQGQARPAPGSAPAGTGQSAYYHGGPGVNPDQVPWTARTPAQTWPTGGLAASTRTRT